MNPLGGEMTGKKNQTTQTQLFQNTQKALRKERLAKATLAKWNRRQRWFDALQPLESRTFMSAVPAPAAPTNLIIENLTPTSIQLNWQESDPNVAGYKVLRAQKGKPYAAVATITSPGTQTFTDNKIVSGLSYSYEVLAIAEKKTSLPTAAVKVISLLGTPTSLSATMQNQNSIQLSWTNNDTKATGYTVLRAGAEKKFTTLTTLSGNATHTYADNSVVSGRVYYYEIQATGANSTTSMASAPASAITPLTAPTGLTAAAGATGVTLTWTGKDTNALGYILLRSTAGKPYAAVGTVSGVGTLTFVDKSAASFTTYNYQVEAVAGTVVSTPSASASASTAMAAPTSLTIASLTPSAINLAWKANEPQAAGYYVLRSTDGGSNFSTLATLTGAKTSTYSDTAVTTSASYQYEVQAFSGSTTSAMSNTAGATTPLSPVTALTLGSVTTGSVTLSWTDNDSHATGYSVLRSTDGGKTFATLATLSDANANTYSDTSAVSGHSYSYEVKATAGSASSANSNIVTANTPLVAPSNLSVTATSAGVQLNWTSNDNNANGYTILRATGTGSFAAVGSVTSGTGFLDHTAASFTAYSYKVQAIAGASISPVTDAATLTTPLAAPTSLAVASSNSSTINLTWKANEPQATGYYVLRSVDGSTFSTIATLTGANIASYSDAGLGSASSYYYRVQAYNGSATSTTSNIVTATTPLAAPSALTATVAGPNSVQLSWTDNDTNATGYTVLRSTDGKTFSAITTLNSSSANSYTDSSAISMTTYFYAVRATGANSVTSVASTATTVTTTPTPAVQLTALATSPTAISLSWKGTDARAAGYQVLRSTDGITFTQVGKTVAATAVAYTDTTAASGHTYTYAINAYGGSGGTVISVMSATATATTALIAPTSLITTVAGTSVTLSWTIKDTNATGYTVLRSTDGTTFTSLATVSGVSTASYTDSTGVAGQTYTYEVQATNSIASSPVSNKAYATIPTGGGGGVTITNRFTNELVITATGGSDSVTITQSGPTLTIVADGQTFTNAVPTFGIFVYARGGSDSFSIDSTVTARTTVESIDGAATIVNSSGSNVSAWIDSTDTFTGTANVHRVASFAGGVTKALGAALANPTDSGTTTKANLSLWGSAPAMSDVNQGSVGDCYFLSTLAAFANQKNAFLQEKAVDLGDGTYAVQFQNNDGSNAFVRVSNDMPTGYFSGYAYAHPGTNNSMWAMVMEKAYCYFRTGANTYSSINSGWMGTVYTQFGISSNILWTSSYSTEGSFYDLLNTALSSGKPVTFGTPSAPPNLVGGHAYTLVSVSKDANGVTHYVVRNPWGVSGDSLENSSGYATLTFAQMKANFLDGAVATS